jgi:hypothetical protein
LETCPSEFAYGSTQKTVFPAKAGTQGCSAPSAATVRTSHPETLDPGFRRGGSVGRIALRTGVDFSAMSVDLRLDETTRYEPFRKRLSFQMSEWSIE